MAPEWIVAGVVGRPHGLDGSVHVRSPRAALLTLGRVVNVAGRDAEIVRRAGTDGQPIVRLDGCSDREAAAALGGAELRVPVTDVPPLGEDEWYADDLEGCAVVDGSLAVGTVRRMVALPSCEVLEVARGAGGADLLVPLVRDAVRSVDVDAKVIDVDLAFLGGGVRIDVFTLFPEWFEWFATQRHVSNALAAGHSLGYVSYRDHTPLNAGQVDDTPFGGGAGMVLRVDVVDAALEATYGADRGGRRVVALTPGGRRLDDALVGELAAEEELTLLCGRYEGFDERIVTELCTDAVSVGPFVLAGGELAAMTVMDALLRKLPGALGHADSAVEESYSEALGGLPEYPHYTRPASYRGWEVPEVLLSGHHAKVAEWRLGEARRRAKAPVLAAVAALDAALAAGEDPSGHLAPFATWPGGPPSAPLGVDDPAVELHGETAVVRAGDVVDTWVLHGGGWLLAARAAG